MSRYKICIVTEVAGLAGRAGHWAARCWALGKRWARKRTRLGAQGESGVRRARGERAGGRVWGARAGAAGSWRAGRAEQAAVGARGARGVSGRPGAGGGGRGRQVLGSRGGRCLGARAGQGCALGALRLVFNLVFRLGIFPESLNEHCSL